MGEDGWREGGNRGVPSWGDVKGAASDFPAAAEPLRAPPVALSSFSFNYTSCFPSLFPTFLLFSTLAFLILTLFFLLFLSSLCRHDEGRKKKGKQSCWQRSASPARGPRCLGLAHHGRRSHLQIRRETLKERKRERRREEGEREKGGTGNTHTHTHG